MLSYCFHENKNVFVAVEVIKMSHKPVDSFLIHLIFNFYFNCTFYILLCFTLFPSYKYSFISVIYTHQIRSRQYKVKHFMYI